MAVRPFLAVDVSLLPGAPSLSQYQLQAKVNWGGGWANVTFLNGDQVLHFAAPATPTNFVRLAGQFDATTHPTGAYPLQYIVTAQYGSNIETFVDSSQHLLVVNDRSSPVAKGWTVVGVQRLYVQSDGAALITSGGGSAAYFSQCGGSCFNSPSGDFSKLSVSGSGGSTVYARAFPDSSFITFNNVGEETSATNRFGTSVAYSYDSIGRLSRVYDPVRKDNTGLALTYTALKYGTTFGLVSIQEPGADGTPANGRKTTFTVASDSTLTAITDPDAVATQFRYDTRKRLTTIIDRRGDTTGYVYRTDSSWKLLSQMSPNVPTDIGGGSTSLQRPTITVVPWQVASVPSGPTGTTPATPILTDSVMATVTDEGGRSARFTVDHWGQPLRITMPLGTSASILRSGPFAVKITSPAGAIDSAAYNASGLLVASIPAGVGATTITYGPYSLPVMINGPGQATLTFTYGHRGSDSLVAVAGTSTPSKYFVDALGRDTAIVDPLGHTTKYHYDATFGNLDSTLAEGGRWTKTVFDHFGRDSLHLANHLAADTTTYDALNRILRVARPGTGASTMSYDALFLTRFKDPKGNVFRLSSDALGRVSKRYDPADTINRFRTYRYSLTGLVTSWTNERAQTTNLAYDSLDRELSETGSSVAPDSFSFNPTGTVAVGWTAAERDSTFMSPSGWTDSVVSRLEPSNKRFRRYYHHTLGNMQLDSTRITTTSGIQFADRFQKWDVTTGLLDQISTSAPQQNFARMSFTPELLDSTVEWGDTVTETLAHTSRHEVMSTTFNVAALNFALSRTYSYDDSLGHIAQVNRPNRGDGDVRRFLYNAAGELAGIQEDSLSSATSCDSPTGTQLTNDGYYCQTFDNFTPIHTWGFAYDSAENLLNATDSVHGSSSIGTYISGNRLSQWGNLKYIRDLDGNDSAKILGSDTTKYSWTADGRLSSVTVGSVKLLYAYNAYGQLAQRSRSVGGGTAVLERQFLWDKDQLFAELDSSGTRRIAEYAYWPGEDVPYAIMTGADSITATRYFAEDQLGNVVGVFTSGAVPQSLSYQAFGALDSAVSSLGTLADTNRLRWKGMMYEGDSTRLYYVHNRWYDPVTGRFLSEDPVGHAGGLNLYVFGNNDPINAADPLGLCENGSLEIQIFMGNADDGDNGVMISCTGGGGGIKIHLGPWDPFDPAIPNESGPIDDGSQNAPNPADDPLARANAIIQGVAARTKGFNNLMNCGMAAVQAGAGLVSDVSLVNQAKDLLVEGIGSITAQRLAYNAQLENLTG
ncbi:MAG TPA: RHS repeat-associated core domain-containing protein, partial [Gemmatimonadaceae bacterium]